MWLPFAIPGYYYLVLFAIFAGLIDGKKQI